MEERDPYKVRELDMVNTQACEQLFRDVNKHTNCQAMSEANFFMFWIYLMDLHNLNIAGLSRVEPDPREEYRTSVIKINNMDLSMLTKAKESEEESGHKLETEGYAEAGSKEVDVNEVVEMLQDLDVNPYKCPLCSQSYKKEGNLKNHLLKHDKSQESTGAKKGFCCELCAQPCATKLALEQHIKVKHLTCSICKTVHSRVEEASICRSKHTTCAVCSFDAKFPSKLSRHMESHK